MFPLKKAKLLQKFNEFSIFPYQQAIVVGGTGQTGHRLVEQLLHLNVKVIATARSVDSNGKPQGELANTIINDVNQWSVNSNLNWLPLDLEKKKEDLKNQWESISLKLDKSKTTLLIISAAYTNVDGCETNPEFCFRINEINTNQIFSWANEDLKAMCVFYSTDYVFDGKDGPYSETFPRNPLSIYGESKANVEVWLEKNIKDFLIVRTTGVYDFIEGSKNFVMNMQSLWQQGKATKVPSDQWSNPVWALELAFGTLALVQKKQKGIFHLGGGEYLARDVFARLIAKAFKFENASITSVLTSELGQKAARPLRGGFDQKKLKQTLNWSPSTPQEAFEMFAQLSQQ